MTFFSSCRMPNTSALVRALLPVILLVTALMFVAWWQRADGRMHVLFLPISGDAVLVQTPAGGFVLIDGGGDPATLTTLLGRRMPFWQRGLDAVVLTLPDSKRLPGQVAALARYQARLALVGPALPRSAGAQEWRRLLYDQRTPVRTARVGEQLESGGVLLTVLALGDGDESGLVLRLDYGHTSVVLNGAGGEADDERLLAGARPAVAVAFPWQRPLPPALLSAWRPRALIFTDAFETDQPALLTTLELAVAGASVYHEKLNGTVELISDGKSIQVIADRYP